MSPPYGWFLRGIGALYLALACVCIAGFLGPKCYFAPELLNKILVIISGGPLGLDVSYTAKC